MRFPLILSLILVLCLSNFIPFSAAQEPASSWCVSVWYPFPETGGGYQSVTNNLDVIDEINPFWYSPNPDGSLLPGDEAENPEQLAALREAGKVIMPSIVSFHYSTMIQTPEARSAHIQHILDLVERMDYDGIDIDYESFALDTREPFSLFVEALSAALHAEGRLLSVTVHPKVQDVVESDGATAQDWSRITAAADVFRIMTYDYHGSTSTPGPVAPLPWVEEVLAYAASVTDLGKVRLGLPFYGYSWQRGSVNIVTWQAASGWIDSFDLTVERDPADMEAHLDFDPPGLPAQNVYISDAVTLEFKLAALLEKYPDLGGVAIWGLSAEDDANWDVLRAFDRGSCDFAPVQQNEATSQIFFDDFNYTGYDDPLLAEHGWTVRDGSGWPGVQGAEWREENVSFVDDPDGENNRLLQMTSSTDGENTYQTQVCHERKYLDGTYASRVYFTNEPISGADGDNIVQTFYTISTPELETLPDYSEMDYEYLPNGGWGIPGNVLFATSWETYQLDPWVADNISQMEQSDFEGWHLLVMQVADGEITYYVDGEFFDTHDDYYYPEVPLSINFNLWFVDGGLIGSGELREYVEQIDWVFHAKEVVLSPEEVEGMIAALREEGTYFTDGVPAWEPALESLCNF